MYLNPAKTGECLTMAYGIMKGSPGVETITKKQAQRNELKAVYDHHLKSQRQNIVSTPSPMVTGKTTCAVKIDTGHKAMNFLEAGELIAAAEGQGEGYKHWARFAYDPDHGAEWLLSGKWVTRQLFGAWCFLNRRQTKVSAQRFEDMAMLCAIDKAHRVACGEVKYTVDKICQHLGYKDGNSAHWGRRLRPHWDFMATMLDRHNNKTLSPVGNKLKIMCGWEDAEKPTFDRAAPL